MSANIPAAPGLAETASVGQSSSGSSASLQSTHPGRSASTSRPFSDQFSSFPVSMIPDPAYFQVREVSVTRLANHPRPHSSPFSPSPSRPSRFSLQSGLCNRPSDGCPILAAFCSARVGISVPTSAIRPLTSDLGLHFCNLTSNFCNRPQCVALKFSGTYAYAPISHFDPNEFRLISSKSY